MILLSRLSSSFQLGSSRTDYINSEDLAAWTRLLRLSWDEDLGPSSLIDTHMKMITAKWPAVAIEDEK